MIPNYDPVAAFNALPDLFFKQAVKQHSSSCPNCGERHGLNVGVAQTGRYRAVILINCPMCKHRSKVTVIQQEQEECP